MDLMELGAEVEWTDSEASTEVRDRLVDEPDLGRLAELAEWAAGVRATEARFAEVQLVVVGAEPHDLVVDTALAVGARVRAVPQPDDVDAGIALADAEIDRGADLLIVAAPEVRADAAVAVAVLTDTEPAKVLARGAAATDPAEWMRLAVEVRDARRRCLPLRDDPQALLAELGSSRLALLTGLVLRAAARRTPVLLDGPVATVAALVAYEVAPRAVRWWAVADLAPGPLHEVSLSQLGQRPVLGTGTGRGDGLAGLLALPVLRAAAVLSAAPAPEAG